ncbi:MAG: YitT family protein [Tidjanibacter sp.]|nr:YitT family protein [Tidjanibacter sp.]
MGTLNLKNLKTNSGWFSWVLVTIGAFILAMGFVLFTNPYKIIPGGVYGLGRVLHHLIPSIQTGTFGLLFDVPLTITAILVFGRQFGAKTIYAALITPVFMNAMTSFLGEDPADGISIISTQFNFSDNVFFAALCGGLLIGVGCGLILRAGATSGGTDIISMLIVKFAKTKFSSAMFLVESTIVIIGMIVLGDWKLPLYSLISIFVCARAIDYVLEGASYDKLLFIISEKKEELKQYILVDMERGGTYIKSSGMYTGNDKDMIFLVISRREIAAVKEKIRALDPMAFVVVVDAYETYGDGFKPFTE